MIWSDEVIPVKFLESVSYLTGVTAAGLRWHLSNIKVIFNSCSVFLQWWKIRKITGRRNWLSTPTAVCPGPQFWRRSGTPFSDFQWGWQGVSSRGQHYTFEMTSVPVSSTTNKSMNFELHSKNGHSFTTVIANISDNWWIPLLKRRRNLTDWLKNWNQIILEMSNGSCKWIDMLHGSPDCYTQANSFENRIRVCEIHEQLVYKLVTMTN